MHNKSYDDYLEPLREREVRTPFARMAELVAATPERSTRLAMPWAKAAAIITLSGMAVLGILVLNRAPRHIAGRGGTARTARDIRAASHSSIPLSSNEQPHSEQTFSRKNRATKEVSLANTALSQDSGLTGAKAQVLHGWVDARDGALPMPSLSSDTRPIEPIAISDSETEHERKFFATIGGALSQQFSSNASFRQFSFSDAFAGIGYEFSRNTSIRLIGGEEAFVLSKNSYFTTYQDTTFSHGGVPYANIIGEVHTVSGASLTRVYWLGGSYRYALGSGSIRPFAEIMAGGSTDGLLTHQSLGAAFSLSSRIELNVVAQASELLPQNSIWLSKAGAQADLSYAF